MTKMFFQILLPLVLLPSSSFAYYSTQSTGELVTPGNYQLSAETEFLTDPVSGVNFVGRFDSSLDESSNLRALVGFGTVDFHIGGFYKWVPVPDTATQPALGLLGGIIYGRLLGEDYLSLKVHPLISKTFHPEFGVMTPYAALPLSLTSGNGKLEAALQAALGVEIKTPHLNNVRWAMELGVDVSKSNTYFSLAAILDVSEDKGIQFR